MLAIPLVLLLQMTPSADEIIGRYVAREQETAAIGARLRYTRIQTEYDLADPNSPKRLEKRESRIWTDSGHVMELTVAVNDGPVLNGGAQEGALSLDKAFGIRFDYGLIRPEPEVCRGCYLMSYEPKPKQPPRRSIPEEILSRTGGTLMLDIDSGAILWLKGTLRKPFRKFIFGKVYEAEIQMSQEPEFGTPMTVAARIKVHYSQFGFNSYRLIELSFFGFELRPETPSP
ncbi:MAG TPA: hypothetical protein VMU12_00785 [Candidatus Paceibacterota bacterium]|nr:hypothetical protein [Candidatus Paceibacterota bacterium]